MPAAEGGAAAGVGQGDDEEEEEAEAQGERPAGDEEAVADGEEGEEEGEAEGRKAGLPPNGRRRRGAPEAEAATGPRGQRARGQRARRQGVGEQGSRPRCWRPELSEEDAATVGLAVLGTLQRRGALRSEALLPLANAALPALAVPVRVALLDSLRLLVRCGYVLRERGGESRRGAPSYALSPLAHQILQRVAAAQGEDHQPRALPSESQSARSLVTPELPPPRNAPPQASASTVLANGSKEAGLQTNPSQDASPAGKAATGVATGVERAGGASGAPAKYRIKRRPKGESGDGSSASHADGEDAARGGGVASGPTASQLEKKQHDPPRPPSQHQQHQQQHHQPPPQHQQYQGGEHNGNRRFVGGDGGGGGGYATQGGGYDSHPQQQQHHHHQLRQQYQQR